MSSEYRLRCTGVGKSHAQHWWKKKNMAKAVQSALDANHHAEQKPDGFYNKHCAPYVVEQRAVSAWQQPQDDDPLLIMDDIGIEVTE